MRREGANPTRSPLNSEAVKESPPVDLSPLFHARTQLGGLETDISTKEKSCQKRLQTLQENVTASPAKHALQERLKKLLEEQYQLLEKHQLVVRAVMRKARGRTSEKQKQVRVMAGW